MKTDFYVYEHWRPDKGVPFYVGKGRGKRDAKHYRRGDHHANILRKLDAVGLTIEVRRVFTGLDEEMAFALERSQIAYWRRRGMRLANRTDGGEGIVGYKHTAEKRAQMSASMKTARGMPEARQKMGIVQKKVWQDPFVRENRKAAFRQAWREPDKKAERIKLRNSPEYKAKHICALKAALAKPGINKGTWSLERRAALSAQMKKRWADPANREKLSVKLKSMSLELSARTKRGMADPKVRRNLSKKLKAYFAANPEAKLIASTALKAAIARRQSTLTEN